MSEPIRTVIADDEPLARRQLRSLLERDPQISLIAEAGTGIDARRAIKDLKPELVLLDVRMPHGDGFAAIENLQNPPYVIFATAHAEHAVRAFDLEAVDYLLKPFDDARFGRALSRAKDRLAHYMPQRPRPVERLVVKSRGQVLFLSVSDIDWIEAASYYACLHVGSDTHLLRRTLSELERDLGDGTFIRIHRSIIVNVERIRGLELQAEGEYEVVLKSKVRLRLSRRFRKRLQDRLGAMSGRD